LYVGGSLGVFPTAADKVVLSANVMFANNSTPYSQYGHVWHSTDGLSTIIVIGRGGGVPSFFMITQAYSADAHWTHPWVAAAKFSLGSSSIMNHTTFHTVSANTVAVINGVQSNLFWTGDIYNSKIAEAQSFADDLNGGYSLAQVGLVSETVGTRGKRGVIPDVWFGSPTPASGDCYPSDGSKSFVHLNEIILPWDGSSTILLTV
jgi:hypothetical protein